MFSDCATLSELNKRRAELVAANADVMEVNKAYTKARYAIINQAHPFVAIPLEYPENKEYPLYWVYRVLGRCEDKNGLEITKDGVYV
jgi:hypothetical protein